MNYWKVKNETQETYKNDTVSQLKTVIFLTKVLKNMHTSVAIFFCTLVIPMALAYFIYIGKLQFSENGWVIFAGSFLLHILIHKFFIMKVLFTDVEETYNEQALIQETLEEMLQQKLNK